MPGNYTVLSDDRCLSEFITSINRRVSFIFTLSASPVFPILFLLFHQNIHTSIQYIYLYLCTHTQRCLYIHVKIMFNQLNQSARMCPLTKLKTMNKLTTYQKHSHKLLTNTIRQYFFAFRNIFFSFQCLF